MAYDKLVLIDFETTGLDEKKHEIIEIGALLCDAVSLDIYWEYERKLKPVNICCAQPEALAVNGYTEEAWAGAAGFRRGMMDFLCKLDHTMIFTGQNVWFDVRFYLSALEQLRYFEPEGTLIDPLDPTPHGYSYHQLDIASMAWPLQKEPVYRMSRLGPAFGIEPEPMPHRAINGVRTEYALLKEIRRRGQMNA